MDDLFQKEKFHSLEQFIRLPKSKLREYGGKSLLFYYYQNNMPKLLSNIYPHYPWPDNNNGNDAKFQTSNQTSNCKFEIRKEISQLPSIEQLNKSNLNKKGKLTKFFSEICNQKQFMNELFQRLELKTLDDFFSVSKMKIQQNGGKNLLYRCYNNDIKLLFQSIYPNFPWEFENLKINRNIFFKSIENQKKFMDDLFIKLKLKSNDDWMKVPRKMIIKNGGESLLYYYYSNDLKKLLSTIYPNYHWKFHQLKYDKKILKNIIYRRQIMNEISEKLEIKSLDDWLTVSKNEFKKNGGRNLLEFYSNNFTLLLSTIYSHLSWQFNDLKFHSNDYFKSIYFAKNKLIELKLKYKINEKKDWYRIPLHNSFSIFQLLRLIYPFEDWKKNYFEQKNKKSNQRLLFTFLNHFFNHYLLIENYQSQNIHLKRKNYTMEFDLFFPSLNLAVEYQGEQHFDDLPFYAKNELYQSRDRTKKLISKENNIILISIPYWWDRLLPSLLSTVKLNVKF